MGYFGHVTQRIGARKYPSQRVALFCAQQLHQWDQPVTPHAALGSSASGRRPSPLVGSVWRLRAKETRPVYRHGFSCQATFDNLTFSRRWMLFLVGCRHIADDAAHVISSHDFWESVTVAVRGLPPRSLQHCSKLTPRSALEYGGLLDPTESSNFAVGVVTQMTRLILPFPFSFFPSPLVCGSAVLPPRRPRAALPRNVYFLYLP